MSPPPSPSTPGPGPAGPLSRSPRLPTLLLWPVPLLFVTLYLLLTRIFQVTAWSGLVGYSVLVVLLVAALAFSPVWYVVGWGAGRVLGTYVPWTFLRLLSSLPVWPKRVVISPLSEVTDRRSRWGKFVALFALILVFEVIYLAGSERRGVLDPFQGTALAGRFFVEILLGGVFLGLLLAPSAPHLFGRLRLRIVDSLDFPLMWLTLMLLLVGGITAALYALFPFTNGGLPHLLLSLLIYAPAAWYLALGFMASDALAEAHVLALARAHPSQGLIVGHLQVREEGTGRVLNT